MSTKTKLKWKPNTQVVDLSLIDDPLAKQKHELVNKSVDILTTEILQDSKYKKQVNFFQTNNVTFDVDSFPKFESHKLKNLFTPEEVQRLLDHVHMTNILKKFNPHLLSPIYVVRLNGKPELFVFDSMHTLTTIAVLVHQGLLSRKNPVTGKKEIVNEGLDFEYPCWVIDTTDESFPSVAALYRNGEGSKPWGPYDYHRIHVRSFEFYNNPGPNDLYKLASQKQKIMVKSNAVPLPEGHNDLGMLGTLSHVMDVAKYKHNDMGKFTFIFETNNKYWNGTNDSSMFGFYGNLYTGYTSLGLPTSGKYFNDFLDEIHAIIKHFFVSMPELKLRTIEAYKDWMKKQNKNGGNPKDNCALALVLKMYVRLGGQYKVLSDVNEFIYSPSSNVKIDIYDSLPLSIRQNVNNSSLW